VSNLSRVQRVHVRLYRQLLRLMPQSHRCRQGGAQVQLFADLMSTGHNPWRLWAGALVDVCQVTFLVSETRRSLMSHIARLALFPLSVLNAVIGLSLAVIAIVSTVVPMWVAWPAGAVALQGAFTVGWLTGRLPVGDRVGDVLFAAGEAAALVIGAVGVVAAVVAQSGSGDVEYGPPTVLTIVALHALVGMMVSVGDRPDLETVR
jgi:hypothetical protein